MRDDNFALDIWRTRRPCRGFRLHWVTCWELGSLLSCEFWSCRLQRREYIYLLSWTYVSRRNWIILALKTTAFCPLRPFWGHSYGTLPNICMSYEKITGKWGKHSNIAATCFGLVSDNIKYGTNSERCGRKVAFAPAAPPLLRHFHLYVIQL